MAEKMYVPNSRLGPTSTGPRMPDYDGPPLVSPIAPVPPEILVYNRPEPVKIPTPDLIVTGESPLPPESMVDLIFQKIGGHEIISISRSENVNGQNIRYQPIKNVGEINREYDSKRIIPLPNSSLFYSNSFAIDILSKIPAKGLGFSPIDDSLNIYVATDTVVPSLIIESVNLGPKERIQVEIIKSSDVFDDTIY